MTRRFWSFNVGGNDEEDDGLTIDGVRMVNGDRIIIDPTNPPSWFSSIPFGSPPNHQESFDQSIWRMKRNLRDQMRGVIIMEEGDDGIWRQKSF